MPLNIKPPEPPQDPRKKGNVKKKLSNLLFGFKKNKVGDHLDDLKIDTSPKPKETPKKTESFSSELGNELQKIEELRKKAEVDTKQKLTRIRVEEEELRIWEEKLKAKENELKRKERLMNPKSNMELSSISKELLKRTQLIEQKEKEIEESKKLIKAMEEELTTKENLISGKIEIAESAKNKAADMKQELLIKTQELEEKEMELKVKEQKIQYLKDMYSELNTQDIIQLNSRLAKKDILLKEKEQQLKKEVEKTNNKNYNLLKKESDLNRKETELDKKEDILKKISSEVSRYNPEELKMLHKEVLERQSIVNEKEEKIEIIRKKVQAHDQDVALLRDSEQRLKDELVKFHHDKRFFDSQTEKFKDLVKKGKKAEEINSKLLEKEKLIKELRIGYRNRYLKLDSLTKKYERLNSGLDTSKKRLDEELKKKNIELEWKFAQDIRDYHKGFAKREKDLEKKKNQILKKENELAEKEQSIKELIDQKKAEIKDYQIKKKEFLKNIKEFEKKSANLDHFHKKKEKALEERIEKIVKENKKRHKDLLDYENKLAIFEKELRNKDQLIREKEEEIEAAQKFNRQVLRKEVLIKKKEELIKTKHERIKAMAEEVHSQKEVNKKQIDEYCTKLKKYVHIEESRFHLIKKQKILNRMMNLVKKQRVRKDEMISYIESLNKERIQLEDKYLKFKNNIEKLNEEKELNKEFMQELIHRFKENQKDVIPLMKKTDAEFKLISEKEDEIVKLVNENEKQRKYIEKEHMRVHSMLDKADREQQEAKKLKMELKSREKNLEKEKIKLEKDLNKVEQAKELKKELPKLLKQKEELEKSITSLNEDMKKKEFSIRKYEKKIFDEEEELKIIAESKPSTPEIKLVKIPPRKDKERTVIKPTEIRSTSKMDEYDRRIKEIDMILEEEESKIDARESSNAPRRMERSKGGVVKYPAGRFYPVRSHEDHAEKAAGIIRNEPMIKKYSPPEQEAKSYDEKIKNLENKVIQPFEKIPTLDQDDLDSKAVIEQTKGPKNVYAMIREARVLIRSKDMKAAKKMIRDIESESRKVHEKEKRLIGYEIMELKNDIKLLSIA